MDFMAYEISKDGEEIVIAGRITEPVNWEFWIRFDENDVPGLVRVATNRSVLGMVLGHWFKKLIPFRGRHRPAEDQDQETQEAQETAETAKPAKAGKTEQTVAEPVASASASQRSASEPEKST
jgi:hypothetical protein